MRLLLSTACLGSVANSRRNSTTDGGLELDTHAFNETLTIRVCLGTNSANVGSPERQRSSFTGDCTFRPRGFGQQSSSTQSGQSESLCEMEKLGGRIPPELVYRPLRTKQERA